MSIWRYLRDTYKGILVYLTAVGIAAAMAHLDSRIRMQDANVAYMAAILLALGIAYLIVDYAVKARHIRRVRQLDWHKARIGMPEAKDFAELCYQQLVRDIIRETDAAAAEKARDTQAEIEFLTLLAHRMKTPVTAISLISEKLDAPQRDALSQELFRLQDDVDKMLYYVRGRAFSDDYVIESADLERIVAASVKKHARLFIGKGLRLESSGLAISVLTDKKWLGFVVDQLISNAIKYSRWGAAISVSAKESGNAVQLTVSDTGAGISEDDLPRVFRRAFTGRNGRLNTEATGMGLFLADKIAKKLGHRVTIVSAPGKGVQATIHISRFSDGIT